MSESQPKSPIIETKQGKVQGIQDTNWNGRRYYAFRGIPYAKPPLGERRFKKSVPAATWEGVKEATTEGSVSRQFDGLQNKDLGSEDCLFLNVFTPQINVLEKKAVMFWIHGGGFQWGSGGLPFYGPGKLMDYDVVLVTINYRLGVFGFLSTGDEVIPGNAGMWDQVLALKWVQQNIAAFGGDPKKVTIFGESAGAAAAALLITSPEGKGLFRNAIIESGNMFNPSAIQTDVQPDPLTYAKMIARELDCPTDSSAAIKESLVRKTEDEIFAAYKKLTVLLPDGEHFVSIPQLYYTPVVESPSSADRFLPDTPSKLIASKRHNRVPVITGIMQNEFGTFNIGCPVTKEYLHSAAFRDYMLNTTSFKGEHLDTVLEEIRKEYFSTVDFNNQQQRDMAFMEMMSDAIFNALNDKFVRILVEAGSPVYMFKFDYRGKNSFASFNQSGELGATHGDEMPYLFDAMPLDGGKMKEGDDELTSKRLLTMWTNFAKTGNPTPSVSKEIPIKWEPVQSKDDINYLNIDKVLTRESNFRVDKARFWNEYLPKVESGLDVKREDF